MSTTNITPETLRAQAALGGDSLREFILGDSKNRADSVARATEALRIFRQEMQNDPVEQRKVVVDTTRVILQESLEAIRAELTDASAEKKTALETELKTVDETKASALNDERAMATTTEFVAAEGREAINDLRAGGMSTWLTYGGVTAATAAAGAWVWNKTVGRLLSWFRTDPNKATWMERIGTFFGAGAGAVLGMLGVRRFAPTASKSIPEVAMGALSDAVKDVKDQVMKSPAGQVIGGVADAGGGAVRQLSETGGVVLETGKRDAELAIKIGQEALTDPLNALKISLTEGLPLVVDNAGVAVWVMGKAIALPTLSLSKVVEWIRTGEKPEDFWLVWGEAGVAYVLGKAAYNLFINGKSPLPKMTRNGIAGGAAMTAMRIAGGPIEAAYDAASTALVTTGRMLTQDGRTILRIQASRTSIASVAAWFAKPSIGTEADINAAITDWKAYEKDADFMEQYGQKDGDVFSQKDVKGAKSYVKKRLAQIKKALAAMEPSATDSASVARLKAAARTMNDANFTKEIDTYVMAETTTPSPRRRVTVQGAPTQTPSPAVVPASTPAVAPTPVDTTVPIQPSNGPVRVQPAPVQPGPGPQRVQGTPTSQPQAAPTPARVAPQATTPTPNVEPDLTLAPVEPRVVSPDVQESIDLAAMADAEGDYELAPAEPAVRPSPEPSADTDGEYQLAPLDEGELRVQDAVARPPVTLQVEVPVEPQVEARPSVSPAVRRIGSDGASLPLPGRGPDDGGDAGGSARVSPTSPRTGPLSPNRARVSERPSSADTNEALPSQEQIDRDLARAMGKKIGGDDDVELGDAAAESRRTGVDIRSGVDTDPTPRTDVDTDTDAKPRFKFRK